MRTFVIAIILALAALSGWFYYYSWKTNILMWDGAAQYGEWTIFEARQLEMLLEEDDIEGAKARLKQMREGAVTRIMLATRHFDPDSPEMANALRIACAEIKSWKREVHGKNNVSSYLLSPDIPLEDEAAPQLGR